MIRLQMLQRPNVVPLRLVHIIRLPLTSPCRPSPPAALSRVVRRQLIRSFQTTPKRADVDPLGTRRYPFPERLLIYHAGTGRTTFLASLKMTTIFVFGFFCFVVTPAYLMAPDLPISRTIAMAGCGIIPFAFVAYTTAPIVTYMHVRLPIYARQSREALQKWVRAGVNKETELDISSMTLLARPKQTSVKVGDLVPVKPNWLGLANYALRPGGVSVPGPLLRRGGKWWQSRPLKQFNVQGFNRDAREGWVWDDLGKQIERRAKEKGYWKGPDQKN